MSRKIELKPCPFCGGKAQRDNQHDYFWITCPGCGIETRGGDSLGAAAEQWNTRVNDRREVARREFVDLVREFTSVCICRCGEKMKDTDLELYLRDLDANLKT